MSTYRYTDTSGDTLAISGAHSSVVLIARMKDSAACNYIRNEDVPTVAAELLKAAGQEGVFVAKPTDAVTELEDGSLRCGATDMAAHAWVEGMRHRAAELIAIADYIESKAQRETEAATKLQERRDALAAKFTANSDAFGTTYNSVVRPVRDAIDAYIALEDERAA